MYGNELDLSSPGDKHLLNQGWRSLEYYFNEVEATDKQKCILQVTAQLILAVLHLPSPKTTRRSRPIWYE